MAEKCDSSRSGSECAAMCCSIDTLGEAADNTKAGTAKMAGEFEGVAGTTLCWVATANNGECGQVQELRIASHIKKGRRPRNLLQEFRVVVVATGDEVILRIL